MESYQAAEPSTKLSELELLDFRHKTLFGNRMVIFIRIKHVCKIDQSYI